MPDDFLQLVLSAFSKILKVIDSESSEFDIRDRIVQHLIRNVLGYVGKEYQIEQKRTDLTILDENNFRILLIETKRLNIDINEDDFKKQAFSYADETTKFICLTNGSKFKLWEIVGNQKDVQRVDLDFEAILKHKRIEKLTSSEKSQILFLNNIRKDVLWNESKYRNFNSYYGQIEIKPDNHDGFEKLIGSLGYILNQLLMSYSLRTFDEFRDSYNRYLVELSGVSREQKIVKKDKELVRKYEKEKSNLEIRYQKFLPFRGYGIWKTLSNRENCKEDENKEIFCKETIYTMLNKLLFIRICEDKGLLPKNISNGGIENLKSHLLDPEDSYKDILNIAYRTAGKLYKHFYEIGILDWYVEGNSDLNRVLNRTLWILNRFNFKEIDRDILGKLYEKYLPYKERKKLGEFYTPEEVIEYILDSIGYKTSQPIEGKDLVDPACGSGGFLVRAMSRLIQRYTEKGLGSREILENAIDHIYGFDINPFACHIAEMNLLFQIVDLYKDARKEDKNYVLKRFNIYQTDSLEAPKFQREVWDFVSQKARQFTEEKVQIEKIKNQKFDFVVMNPPYVHQKGASGEPTISYDYRKYIRKFYETVYDKNKPTRGGIKLNLFVPFIERSIKNLKNRGFLGFIVHKNLLKVESYKLSREFILRQCRINKIVDLGAGVFEDVTGETTIIILKKEKRKTERSRNKIQIVTKVNNRKALLTGDFETHSLPQNLFHETMDNMFSIYYDAKFQKIRKRLETNSVKLGDITNIISFGLNTIDNKKYISDVKLNVNYKRAIMGRDISKYIISNRNRYVLYDDGILSRVGDEEAFLAKEKIVMQRIGGDLIAAYDDEQFYCFNSINMILPKDKKYNLKYILAILNSDLMNLYFKQRFASFARLTVNVTQGYLSQFPIHIPTDKELAKITKLVNTLLTTQKGYLKSREISINFDTLLEDLETTKLSEVPNITFRLSGDKIEELRLVGDTVYLSLVDAIECRDVSTAKYVFYWLKSRKEDLTDIYNKRRITNINIPKGRKKIERIVVKYEFLLKQSKELPSKIKEMEKEINKAVESLYM